MGKEQKNVLGLLCIRAERAEWQRLQIFVKGEDQNIPGQKNLLVPECLQGSVEGLL